MKSLETPVIPNIDMGDSYDTRYAHADIHIDSLHNLSNFFGRDMTPHRHDRFYQLHFLRTGGAQVQLGEKRFSGRAPLFYFTPPAIPHAFHLDAQAQGLVLTVRRDLVHRALAGGGDEALEQRFSVPVFQPLNAIGGNLTREAERLPRLMDLLAEEFYEQQPGRRHTLPALVNLVLICVFRLSHLPERSVPLRRIELEIFQAFNELIDRHHRAHWSLAQYSAALNVTQSRLGDICRRMSGTSCKSLVHEHQVEEAKWKLIYTTAAINVIADELGFADPAYFCRFFTRHCGMSPRQFRQRALKGEL